MKKLRPACMQWIAVGLTLVVGVAPCLAQPAMSRGQQQLPTNYADCLNRARQALNNVGFSVGGAGNFAQGFKDTSGAYIICNDAPGGGVIVNIVVATNTNDAGVPGNLRQLLQAQMERPAAALPPSGVAVACGEWDWLDHIRVTLHPDGTSNNQSGGQGQWEVLPDGRVHLYWKTYNSNDYLTFVDANTANGNFNGRQARITRVGACQAAAQPPIRAAAPCGEWDWLDHIRVTLHPDGTSNNPSGGQGQWEVLPDGRVHLYWKTYNSNDYLTFVDANTANGNFNGQPARITRVGACPAR